MNRFVKILIILAVLIVGIPIVLFGGAFALAQTDLAKDQIGGIVEDSLTGPGRQAEVSDLEGVLPFDIRIGQVRLSDDEGTWLEVDSARVKTSPADLLAGRIVVEEVGIQRIALNRLPPPAPEADPEQPEEDTNAGLNLPELPLLPSSIPTMRLDRLHIDRIELGEPVLGDTAIFNLEGQAASNDEGTSIDASLELKRIDEESAAITLDAGADFAAQTVRLAIDGSETGSLTALLSGQENAGDLSLAIMGQGPLDDFNADIDVGADNVATIKAQLGFGIGEIPKLVLKGNVETAEGLLPPEITDLIGRNIDIDIDAQERSAGLFTIESLALNAGEVRVSGGGLADLNTNTIDIDLKAGLGDLSKATGLAGMPLGGTTNLSASVKGALDQPQLALVLSADQLAADIYGIDALQLMLDANPLDSMKEGYPGAEATGSLSINGIRQADEPILGNEPVTFDFAATAPTQGLIELTTFDLNAGEAELTANAALDATDFEGSANADLRIESIGALLRSLGPLAPADLDIDGSVNLDLDTEISENIDMIAASLSLKAQELSGLPGGADGIAGPDPSLSANLEYNAEGPINIRDLLLQAQSLALTGDLSLDQTTEALEGRIELDVPTLSSLNEIAGQELEGAVDVGIDVSGTTSSPAAALLASIRDLSAAGQSFDQIELDAKVEDAISAPAGTLRLDTFKGDERLGLSTGFQKTGAVIDLNNLNIEGPTTGIGGDLSIDTENLRADGGVKGAIGDISRLAPWIGQSIAGSLDIDLTMASSNGGQDIDADIQADGVEGTFGSVGSATIAADINDLMGALTADLSVGVQQFSQPGLTIEDALIDVQGPLSDLVIKADVTGDQNGPLIANLQARAAIDGTVETLGPESLRSLTLEKLDAETQGQTFELQQPAAITINDGVLDLDQLDLKIGQGTVQGKASFGESKVFADLKLDGFALETVESLGGPPLSGTLNGAIGLEGTRAKPELAADFAIQSLAATSLEDAQHFVDLESETRISNGTLSTILKADGFADQPLQIRASMPLGLSLEPFVANPDLDKLTISADGRADLAKIASFAALDGQRVEGTLTLAIDVDGPLEKPSLNGSIGIVDGLVEDINTGALLQEIDVMIEASGQNFEIAEFNARDEAQGTLNVSGNINIDAARGRPFDINLLADDLHLLRSDLGDAWFNVDLDAAGTMQRAAIIGTIASREIDLRIPSRFASNVDAIDVKEINGPDSGEDVTKTKPPIELALDIAIDIPARLFIRGRGLDSEWGGNLTVKGTGDAPQLAGTIEFRRGHLDLLDRRFSIEEGLIDFDGAIPPDPSLNFIARAEGETIDAIVNVFGQSSAPEIQLTSDPERPQDEVLAQLLFGRELSEVTPAQGIRLAAAANKLQGGSGLDPLGSLRDTVGLDTLDVGGESVDQASARAGKYLTEQVYFEIERGVTANSGKARVEVELNENLSANTEFSEDSQTGVGLDWSFDY